MFSNRLEFKGAVIGMLLGDACIPKIQRGVNASLRIGHSIKQKAYMEYKRPMLEYLTGCRVYEPKVKVLGKEYGTITLDTRVHPMYTKLREHMYIDGRKTVDEHVMKCLTPLGLALLYQDDGTLINHEGFLTPFLCTHGFSKTEVEMMSRMIQKRFGLQWRLRKDKQYYALRLRRSDRKAFYDLISPYVCPSMEYKVRDDGKEATGYGSKIDKVCKECDKAFQVSYKNRNRVYCGCSCYHKSREKRGRPQANA